MPLLQKCVANEETGGSPVSHYLGGFSNNCEMKKWLANASRFSAHSTMEAASSACSSVTNMAYFCEANEVCGSFEECIEDNPSESCLGKYNEWLAASSYKVINRALKISDIYLNIKNIGYVCFFFLLDLYDIYFYYFCDSRNIFISG